MVLTAAMRLAGSGKLSRTRGYVPCIPGQKSRGTVLCYDKRKFRRRNRIKIMFGRFKDRRRIATRYDRCAKTFLSAVALAASLMFWLCRSMRLEPIQPVAVQATLLLFPLSTPRPAHDIIKARHRGIELCHDPIQLALVAPSLYPLQRTD